MLYVWYGMIWYAKKDKNWLVQLKRTWIIKEKKHENWKMKRENGGRVSC